MSDEAEVKRLFQAVGDLPVEDRPAFLDEACPDPAVRKRVEVLLAAAGDLGEFLADTGPAEDAREGPGSVIDRYKLLQQIGEGGFGVVYMAEQTEPVRRKVALKVLKPGMDTKQVIARFEAERQALALMDHPNIARVLDAGATRLGHPYFVMELVKGVPITQYADEAKLDTRERLRLFQDACRAIQHAHQKGIIHRDLKPSNILVTLHDGQPVPKVIDFGIAKATDHRLTEKTLFTEFRQMIGTPEYMAPEQAEMSGLDVDTRADIYSLGVLLYEILTGKKPFDFETLLHEGYGEILRHIREVDPPKPSTRVSTLGPEATVLADKRHTEPAILGRLLRGDLDWIVMKALEKDRSRRYETANALAMDVERYLSDDEVKATPPSARYRLRKYVRRHKTAVLASGLVAASLIVGLVAATTGWLEADAQRERAEAREREARTEAARAQNVVGLMKRMIGAADPDEVRGANFTVRELLADFDRELGPDALADQPEVAATIHGLLGGVYVRLGLFDEGQRHLDLARKHGDGVLPADHEIFVDALVATGRLMHLRGRYADADATYRKALEMIERRDESGTVAAARIQGAVVENLIQLARLDDAEEVVGEALAVLEPIDAPVEHIRALTLQGEIHHARGDLIAAEASYRKALDIAKRKLGADDPRASWTLRQLAWVLSLKGDRDAALEMGRRALSQAEAQYGEDHLRVSTVVNGLYLVHSQLGRDEEALELARRDLEIKRRHHGESSGWVGIAIGNVAVALDALGRHEEARPLYQQAVGMQRAHFGEHPEVVNALRNLAVNARLRGDFEAASKHLDEVFALAERTMPPDHPHVASLYEERSALDHTAGDYVAMEANCLEALEIQRRAYGPGNPRVIRNMVALGRAVWNQGRLAEAQRLIEEALGLARASPDPHLAPYVLSFMVSFVPPSEQIDLVREALASSIALRGADHWVTWDFRIRLADVLHDAGDHEAAAKLYPGVLERLDDVYRGGSPDVRLWTLTKAVDTLMHQEHPQAAPARAALDRLLEEHPRGWAYAELAATLRAHGQIEQATNAYTQARELLDPNDQTHWRSLAETLVALAARARDLGDADEARALLTEALELERRQVAWLEREQPGTHVALVAKLKLADRLHNLGDDAAAAPLFVELLPVLERILPDPATRLQSLNCALVAVQAGASEADREAVAKAFVTLRRAHFPHGSVGCCGEPRRRHEAGRHEDTVRMLRGVVPALRASTDVPCKDVLEASMLLARALRAAGDEEAARDEARRMHAETREKYGEHLFTSLTANHLGRFVPPAESVALLREAAEIAHKIGDASHARIYELNLAEALLQAGQVAEAASYFKRLWPFLEELESDPAERQRFLLNAGLSLLSVEPSEAAAVARELIELQEAHPPGALDQVLARKLLGDALAAQGDVRNAIPAFREGLGLAQGVLPVRDVTHVQLRVGLALALFSVQPSDEAVQLAEGDLDQVRTLLGDHPIVIGLLNVLGTAYPPERAAPIYAEAVERSVRVFGPEHIETRNHRLSWAIVLQRAGEDAAAAEQYLQAWSALPDLVPDAARRLSTMCLAASCLVDVRHAEAQRVVTELEAEQAKHLPAGDPGHAVALMLRGILRTQAGEAAEAEPLLRRAVAIRAKAFPEGHWLTANVRSILGACLTALERFDEAEALLLEAYEQMDPPEPWTRRKREALERIVALYDAWDKPDEAATRRERLSE